MKKPGAPKIPNVAWRDGRPRFVPGEPIRKLGFKGESLIHPDGTWFTAGEALDWANRKAEEIAAKRAELVKAANHKRPKGAKPLRHAPVIYSLADLFEDWKRSPRWVGGEAIGKRQVKQLAENTRNNYRWKMAVIAQHDHELFHAAVDALDGTILFGLYEDLWAERGLSTARGCIATISSAISWGMKRGKVRLATNPAQDLGMQMPEIVVRFGEREEIAALVAAADAMGRPEIGDMITLGVWTGQRQNDRLALVEETSELSRGRRMFRQHKTGALVSVLESPELRDRLAAARRRRKKAGIENPRVIMDERQWLPWNDDHYRHTYADVRALAVAGLKVGETVGEALKRGAEPRRKSQADDTVATLWKLKPCPSVVTLHDRHLRATAVVWMALGGATIPEIISVTGHTPASATTILRHYLARHPEMADAAIAKMVVWFKNDPEHTLEA
ncbi:hypothetical protein NS226_03850 [Aureimonas ureilytica]|uniref:Tyr recombinase domain-containing protein n=1 Tax=Aureimonas ureilytica TaxID=401562 RepID=A0A175RDC3_9HYPH|nr:hypothetical protein [Aureimonas ureilytica]KTQ97783.1 hypothetical protein NS226_03850 [Aureimonas ureilytica]